MEYDAVFSSHVKDELQESYDWYEGKQLGLGERFPTIIERAVSTICRHPAAFSIKLNKFREYPVPKFPYVIIYEIVPDKGVVYILHVFNTYLNPKKK
jgi:hypothetical protein